MERPVNEQGVVALFSKNDEALGFVLMEIQTRYPDASVYEINTGQLLNAEFEYKSSNFKYHGHDAGDCDLIICWRNDWKESPIAVLSLEDRLNFNERKLDAEIIRRSLERRNERELAEFSVVSDKLQKETIRANLLATKIADKQVELGKQLVVQRHAKRVLRSNFIPGVRDKPWRCGCGECIGLINDGDLKIRCPACSDVRVFHAKKPQAKNIDKPYSNALR